MLCEIEVSIVNGLREKFGERLDFEVVDHSTDESQTRIAKYGIEVHGMVITDQDDGVVWKESGHQQVENEVAAVIEKELKG